MKELGKAVWSDDNIRRELADAERDRRENRRWRIILSVTLVVMVLIIVLLTL